MYNRNGYEIENKWNGYVQEKAKVDMCVTFDDEIIPTEQYHKRIHPNEQELERIMIGKKSPFSLYMERSV